MSGHSIWEAGDTFRKIALSCTSEELTKNMNETFQELGVMYYNYGHTDAYTNKQFFLFQNNYPPSWLQRYLTRRYATVDPAFFAGKMDNAIHTWNEACTIQKKYMYVAPRHREILKSMLESVQSMGLENGVGIPIVSNAYRQHGFYLAFDNAAALEVTMEKHQLGALCVAINSKFLELESKQENAQHKINLEADKKIPFTDKEKEYIYYVYQGKERSDIATLMDISINTVDSIARRVFLKIRVNSKVQLICKIIMLRWHYILFTPPAKYNAS